MKVMGIDSRESSEGVVADYDATGRIRDIDIDHASEVLELRELVMNHLPVKREVLVA